MEKKNEKSKPQRDAKGQPPSRNHEHKQQKSKEKPDEKKSQRGSNYHASNKEQQSKVGKPESKASSWSAPARESLKGGNNLGSAAPNLIAFCESLRNHSQQSHHGNGISRLIETNPDMWTQAIEAVAHDPKLERYTNLVVKVFIQLPDRSSFSIPPLKILALLQKLLQSAQNVSPLRLFLEASNTLLRPTCMSKIKDKEEVLGTLDMMNTALGEGVQRMIAAQPTRVQEIVAVTADVGRFLSNYNQIVSNLQIEGGEHDDASGLPTYLQWSSSPRLKWLQDAEWLQHTPIKEQYETVEEYALAVKSLWTALSFYWGAGALSPRCHHSDNGQACLNPLLAVPRHNKYCTMKIQTPREKLDCGKPAKYCCFRHGHDAICTTCFRKKQQLIIGAPGHREASTDIYDANVQFFSTKNDSTVLHLSNFSSRKPPEAAINWPTTYRLQPTSLVALVILAVSRSPLDPEQRVFWGEIISNHHNDDSEEYSRRRRGELTIRLLTKQDCIFLNNEAPSFHKGSNVAIIDLRVFVPEVISVLSTLCNPSFEQSLKNMPFANKLLGIVNIASPVYRLDSYSTLQAQVSHAIFNSDIRCIKRFSEADKQLLVSKICAIPNVATMDRTQRDALCSALQSSVHCTQGPPGTGKSYTGVALVLALMQVREIVKKNGGMTGPIISLSYKNHALDEFLVDILKSCDQYTLKNRLIRLGNPENLLLKNFTERSSVAESNAKKNLEDALSLIRLCATKVKELSLGYLPVNLSVLVKLLLFIRDLKDKSVSDLDAAQAYEFLNRFNREILQNEHFDEVKFLQLALVADCVHWNKPGLEIYRHWIEGRNPPPRCRKLLLNGGKETQCMNCAHNGSYFCAVHCCHVQDCTEERGENIRFCSNHKCSSAQCPEGRMSPSPYCNSHTCSYCLERPSLVNQVTCSEHTCRVEGCLNGQLLPLQVCLGHKCLLCYNVVSDDFIARRQLGYCDNHKCNQDDCLATRSLNLTTQQITRYCADHTCFKCIEVGGNLDAETEPPRYTCSEHILCDVIDAEGDLCYNLAVDKNTSLCVHHLKKMNDIVTCHGVTSKGKQCKARKPLDEPYQYPWYCRDHKIQKPEKKVAEKIAEKTTGNAVLINLSESVQQNQQYNHMRCCWRGGCHVITAHQTNDWLCPFHSALHLSMILEQSVTSPSAPELTVTTPEEKAPAEQTELSNQKAVESTTAVKKEKAKSTNKREDEEYAFASDDEEYVAVPGDDQFSNNIDEMEVYTNGTVQPTENADEKESEAGEEEEEDANENENQQKRNELYQSESDSDDEQVHVAKSAHLHTQQDDKQGVLPDVFKQLAQRLCAWDWKMTTAVRQTEASNFLIIVSEALSYILKLADPHIDVLRKERAEANAAVLKQATIIGGTVVGAAKRLMALRAAEPFAVVVEEACEVMEPTLVAVLAVQSVQKLELIGDHRQLPAFINHNWYNFEMTVPRIKKSLFERLIDCSEKSPGGESICTVLDVQRRMKPYISDITRSHYADKVEIIDHEKTKTQCVGDKVEGEKARLKLYRSAWTSKGANVPGILSNIFFWNLKNNGESRPIAGLSACNQTEALAVANLTKYLQFCGVPDTAITIITPYQGQKRILIKALRDIGCLERPNYKEKGSKVPSKLTVSTVDRYQGDENDVVILTLVRTRPGNRFVSLVNRFIVATSRARIGFYIIGSKSAICNDNNGHQDLGHWEGFLQQLEQGVDSTRSNISDSMPICCPIHEQTIGGISSANAASMAFPTTVELWNGFCSVPCTALLRCGHRCSLPCHLYDLNNHNKMCSVMLPRNCTRHMEDVPCHEKSGVAHWRCQLVDEYKLPNCNHSVELECYEYKGIENGDRDWPECKKIVPDFIHPVCNHVFKNMTCEVRRKYEIKPPDCTKVVVLRRSCGHEVHLRCCDSTKPLGPCKVSVNKSKPRCRHSISLPCHEHESLVKSYEKAKAAYYCEPFYDSKRKQIILELGESEYGIEESKLPGFTHIQRCMVPTSVRKLCSHETIMPCADAFDAVMKCAVPDCQDLVTVSCLFCISDLTIPCCKKEKYESQYNYLVQAVGNRGAALSETSLLGFKVLLKPMLTLLLGLKCANKVRLSRECDSHHDFDFPCVELTKYLLGKRSLPICREKITQTRACGHSVGRKCHQRDEPLTEKCDVIINKVFTFPVCKHELLVKECYALQELEGDYNPKCSEIVSVSHLRCGHQGEVCCFSQSLCQSCDTTYSSLKLSDTDNIVDINEQYCSPITDAPLCSSLVDVRLSCGHTKEKVQCHEAFTWTLGENGEEPVCDETVHTLSPLCGHELPIACCSASNITTWNPWQGIDIRREIISVNEGLEEFVFHFPFPVEAQVPAAISKVLPQCSQRVGLIFDDCQHLVKMPCHDLFLPKKPLQCEEQVAVQCRNPHCEQVRVIPCGRLKHMSEEDLARDCPFKIEKTCSICGVNKVSAPCGQVLVECKCLVRVTLPCGHMAEWKCADGISSPSNYHDYSTGMNKKCKECAIKAWEMWRLLDFAEDQLRIVADNKLQGILKESVVQSEELIAIDISQYEKARETNIVKLQSGLQRTREKYAEEDELPWPVTQDPEDVLGFINSCYELCFLPIYVEKANPDNIKSNRLRKNCTVYGQGVMIKTLTSKSLEALLSEARAEVRLCLCLAYTGNKLQNTLPFMPALSREKLNDVNKRTQAEKQALGQADKQRDSYQNKGYDCVEVMENKEITDSTVYWHPHAIIPLKVVTIEIRNCCLLCFEPKPKIDRWGAICKQGHFVCWGEDCFVGYLESAKQVDAISSFVNAEGHLCCPQCKEGYDILKIGSQAPGNLGTELINLKCQFLSNKEVMKAVEEERQRYEAEQKKIREMDEKQREVYHLRKQICEDILTNHCPDCKRAFFEFDGCFAITCSGQGGCGMHFCAWCLTSTGRNDAHVHVYNCGLGNGNVYGDINMLKVVWNRQRKEKIINLLKDRSPDIRKATLTSLAKDFKDLGLDMRE